MRGNKKNSGFTGVEIMVAVAVLAVLVGVFVGVGGRIRAQAKAELTKSTITILGTALEQYYDYWQDFPPDCNYLNVSDFETLLKFDDTSRTVQVVDAPADDEFGGDKDKYAFGYSGIAGMYICMSRTPSSRQVLSKIDEGLLKTETTNKDNMMIKIDSTEYPLFYVLDSWKTPLRYSRTWVNDSQNRTAANFEGFTKDFPKIESAGPDKTFDTEDDITSKEN